MNTMQQRMQPGGATGFVTEHSHRAARLLVQRTGIRFHNLAPGRVLIEIEVDNLGDAPSKPTTLRLESAPFGAFVRWSPLTSLSVPAIAAGGRTLVRTVVRQPGPRPVGSSSVIVPRALLTAAGFEPGRRGRDRVFPRNVALWGISRLLGRRPRKAGLPPNFHDLLDGPHPHWSGNLNVWIGRHPVERHMAPRLRIFAGRANLAAFCVGERRDEYAFRLEVPDEDWTHALIDPLENRCIASSSGAWRESRWYELSKMHYVFLVMRPPVDCVRGDVRVHVTQRSSMKEAVVEFDLDPAADGPGCYEL